MQSNWIENFHVLKQNLPLKSSPVAAPVLVARTTEWRCFLSVLHSHFSFLTHWLLKVLLQKSRQRWYTTQTTEPLLRTDVLVLSGVITMHFWHNLRQWGKTAGYMEILPLFSLVNTVLWQKQPSISMTLKSLWKTWTRGQWSSIPTSKYGEEEGGALFQLPLNPHVFEESLWTLLLCEVHFVTTVDVLAQLEVTDLKRHKRTVNICSKFKRSFFKLLHPSSNFSPVEWHR